MLGKLNDINNNNLNR